MGTFRQQMAADVANVVLNPDEFGGSVTYCRDGGGEEWSKPVDAVIDLQDIQPEDRRDGRVIAKRAHAVIALADVADPAPITDYIEWNGENWTVEGIIGRSSAHATLLLRADVDEEKSVERRYIG